MIGNGRRAISPTPHLRPPATQANVGVLRVVHHCRHLLRVYGGQGPHTKLLSVDSVGNITTVAPCSTAR